MQRRTQTHKYRERGETEWINLEWKSVGEWWLGVSKKGTKNGEWENEQMSRKEWLRPSKKYNLSELLSLCVQDIEGEIQCVNVCTYIT